MAWLWLLFPAVLLVAAALVWQATLRLDRRRARLQAQIDALRATGPRQAHR
jgi:cytochrome c-type biogenesis protein CcmH/NrfF